MIIYLQFIDFQIFQLFQLYSHGYETKKELHLENQALTTNFNLHY